MAGHNGVLLSSFSFRPSWWAVVLTILLSAGMIAAGFWQYGRGLQKQAMQADRARSSAAAPPGFLDDVSTPVRGQSRRVRLQGRYLADLGVLLDNQPHQGKPGVHAWVPVLLADGRRLIVDRGWLPLGAPVAPPPAGELQIEGHWRDIPKPGMRMGTAPARCETPRPALVNYPDLAAVRCLFGETTLDGLLELDARAPGGFERDWATAGANEIPPARHFGYAVQWWLFAVTLIALFIKINLKKRPDHV